MMRGLYASLLLGAASLLVPARADAMRCHSRLISTGDTVLKLEQRCGRADFVTTQPLVRTITAGGTVLVGAFTNELETVEIHVYRGRPGQLASFVEIRRGLVFAIRRVLIETDDDPVRCQKVVNVHDEIGKVRLACGSPLNTAQWTEERAVLFNGALLAQVIKYDRWFYDLGDGRFERILTFENGTLVSVEEGDKH